MNIKSLVASATLALSLGFSAAQASTVNVALSSDGATFVSATSQIFSSDPACCGGFINGGLTTAQSNILTTTPTPWLANGDTRFIFGNNDPVSSLIIKLGSVSTLVSFGATFSSEDRVPSVLAVSVSLDGINFDPLGIFIGPNGFASGGSSSLLTAVTPVSALYVEYLFGSAVGQNGAPNGAGVSEVFANIAAVPEPSTWAMMLLGFVGLGFMFHRKQRAALNV